MHSTGMLDWLQPLKHFFINVSYCILVASLQGSDDSVLRTLKQSHQSKTGCKYMIGHIDEKLFKDWSQSTGMLQVKRIKIGEERST